MKKKVNLWLTFLICLFCTDLCAKHKVYDMTRFGIFPDTQIETSSLIQKVLDSIKSNTEDREKKILRFAPGRYDFYDDNALERELYISNHDQNNPKKVGIVIENMHNLILDGQGAEFIFHGQMLPISLIHSSNCQLKNFSIDFENPHIAQIKVVSNNIADGIIFEVAPWIHYRISKDSLFEIYGNNWSACPSTGIAFEENTKRVVYRTSDLQYSTKGITEIAPRILKAPLWKDEKLIPGTVIAMRTYHRPNPGIFLSQNKNTSIHNVKIHYAEGMGLLAQLCENITLNKFNVCLKGDNDPRYFTTQADATHFSGCKGKIISKNGLYENMMDDAINVHGTYLKIIKRLDDYTLIGRYMHEQSWGFKWGEAGDKVQFIRSATMDTVGYENQITAIYSHDKKEEKGSREFIIKFKNKIAPSIDDHTDFGIENLTWTPEVVFSENIIRNNRARGALFSTPCKTVVEKNLFDHTSGTAILLCGDCNGWYETGSCKNVTIRKNRFINALTSMFQFTNAIISIYPEIPDLQGQKGYFHGGENGKISIVDNIFETFDIPILYAKSVNGLIFKNNKILKNTEYEPYHWNKKTILLESVTNAKIKE